MSRPGGFTPREKARYPCGSQGRAGWVREISPLPGFDLRTVEPVASRHIDHPIPAHGSGVESSKMVERTSMMMAVLVGAAYLGRM
jgi:hypothetical protein